MAKDRDDFDDRPPVQLGPLDKMYRDTNIVFLVLFGVCCGLVAAVLSLVCYLTAKDPKAKSNALIVLIAGAVMFVVNMAVYFLYFAAAAGAAAGR